MIIKLDSNEVSTAPWVLTQISTHPLLGIPEVVNLPAGDIWLDDLIIERKEPADLLASIADGRLFNQCAEMRLESAWCYILIMGQLNWGYDGKIIGTGWNFRSVEGALLQCQELGVSVVHAQSDADLCTTLIWLARRKRTQHVFLPQREAIMLMPDEKVLASLPGVGRERALELLKERNLRDALFCLIDPECKVKGVGVKTKANIREIFNLNEGEKLGVTK